MSTKITQSERNKKNHEKAKERIFTIRLTNEQSAEIMEAVKETGKRQSEIIRAKLSGITIRQRNTKLDEKVFAEMSAWGNNLNQLARVANEAHKAGIANYGLLIQQLEKMQAGLQAIREKL